jgi:hypothetical protein
MARLSGLANVSSANSVEFLHSFADFASPSFLKVCPFRLRDVASLTRKCCGWTGTGNAIF